MSSGICLAMSKCPRESILSTGSLVPFAWSSFQSWCISRALGCISMSCPKAVPVTPWCLPCSKHNLKATSSTKTRYVSKRAPSLFKAWIHGLKWWFVRRCLWLSSDDKELCFRRRPLAFSYPDLSRRIEAAASHLLPLQWPKQWLDHWASIP